MPSRPFRTSYGVLLRGGNEKGPPKLGDGGPSNVLWSFAAET